MWGISFTPPWDGKPYAVVCYARSDRKKAASVISQLRRGTALRMQICADPSAAEEAQLFVEHCSAFICLVSRRFMSDSFCSNLLLFAARAGIKVIPVKLDSVKMPWESGNGLALSGEPRNTYSVKDRNLMKSMFSGNEELFKCLDMSSPSHSLAYLYTDSRPEPAKSVPRPSGPEPVARARTAGRSPAPKRSSGGGLAEKLKDLWKNRNPAKKLDKAASQLAEARSELDAKLRPPAPPARDEDRVSFSVLSPKAVRTDTSGIINLHMYTAEQREIVDRAIRESDGLLSEISKGGFSVQRQTSVTARLSSPDITLTDEIETQIWTGVALHFDFLFTVPADYSHSQIAFVCHIEYNGIPFTRLNFLVAVSSAPVPGSVPAKVVRSDYTKAFISYSREDEQRMLARVLSIRELAPGMKFWLDKQSMDAGVLWREEIRKAILISDVLLLFWSLPASRSAEVEKEWRFGLEQRGLSFIAPVPLDPPEQCPPPEALQELNFSVRAFSAGDLPGPLSFYDSNNLVVL